MKKQNPGIIVKARRNELGMTMREFAKVYNLSPALVSQIEKGKIKTPTMKTISAIAKALELPVLSVCNLFSISSIKQEENNKNNELSPEQQIKMLLSLYGFQDDSDINEILNYIKFKYNSKYPTPRQNIFNNN